MEYQEIKVGESYKNGSFIETVLLKHDETKSIMCEDKDGSIWAFKNEELKRFKPLELPKEGVLYGKSGGVECFVYRTGERSGYGFENENYYVRDNWSFIENPDLWKPATPEQKKQFVEMLKQECEKRGLFDDTKIEGSVDIEDCDLLNKFSYEIGGSAKQLWNKNGQIFYKGKFAKPLQTNLLEYVTDFVKDLGNFTIEETPTGMVVITPIRG